MRNILRRPRIRGVVVAAALAAGLVGSVASAADADLNSSPTPAVAPAAADAPAAAAAAPAANATQAEEAEDAAMAAAASSCYSTYLSYGSRGTCVRLLQKNLGALTVDGVYGSGTRSRVRSFQDDTGLAVDGKVGPQTWRKLRTYGKAIGWKSGVTVYMCKESSTRFRYSAWNNSGKTAWWTFETWRRDDTMDYAFSGNNLPDDRIAAQGRIAAGAYNSTRLTVYLGSFDPGNGQTTTSVRSFARNTLPACV